MRLRHLTDLCKDARVVEVGNVVCRIGKENQVLAEMKNCKTVVKTQKAATRS